MGNIRKMATPTIPDGNEEAIGLLTDMLQTTRAKRVYGVLAFLAWYEDDGTVSYNIEHAGEMSRHYVAGVLEEAKLGILNSAYEE